MPLESLLVEIDDARTACAAGQVLAYPTEAVYGLGCDPFHEAAVRRILTLKERAVFQGLIVIIAKWSQLFPLIAPISDTALSAVQATWPGPVTWVFPKSAQVPSWVSGAHPSIAIRMTAHPIARALCQEGPLISTSANIHGQAPARSLQALATQFPTGIDVVVKGELGNALSPSAIFDVLTGKKLR